jgi:hypothetical protein
MDNLVYCFLNASAEIYINRFTSFFVVLALTGTVRHHVYILVQRILCVYYVILICVNAIYSTIKLNKSILLYKGNRLLVNSPTAPKGYV